jgi:hypothetical protein
MVEQGRRLLRDLLISRKHFEALGWGVWGALGGMFSSFAYKDFYHAAYYPRA